MANPIISSTHIVSHQSLYASDDQLKDLCMPRCSVDNEIMNCLPFSDLNHSASYRFTMSLSCSSWPVIPPYPPILRNSTLQLSTAVEVKLVLYLWGGAVTNSIFTLWRHFLA
jgi:hypothetical protein